MDRTEYDWARMSRAMRPGSNQYLVAMRATQLDDWSTGYLRRYPNAVVLHLGCGMDTRAFRLHPPESVQWFDLDQPNVIALRRKLYDDCAGYRMIGSSVTDEAWLDEIPTDRPMLMVAEGLVMYLTEPQVRTAAAAPHGSVRQRRAHLRHSVADGAATVQTAHQRHYQVGHP
jgi:O-methyltransferase involved in polyketide biosynthesis